MSAFPGFLGGRSRDRSPDWFDEIARQLDRFVDASTGEAKSLADGVRRTFSGERLENAFASLRSRLKRSGAPALDPERELRVQVRAFGLERTIEEWTRHAVQPPSIRM